MRIELGKFNAGFGQGWPDGRLRTLSQQFIIAGGEQGVIKSAGYIPGEEGFAIFGTGFAEFNDITIRGDVISALWDGGDGVLPSVTATLGYKISSSQGAAQFTEIWFPEGSVGNLPRGLIGMAYSTTSQMDLIVGQTVPGMVTTFEVQANRMIRIDATVPLRVRPVAYPDVNDNNVVLLEVMLTTDAVTTPLFQVRAEWEGGAVYESAGNIRIAKNFFVTSLPAGEHTLFVRHRFLYVGGPNYYAAIVDFTPSTGQGINAARPGILTVEDLGRVSGLNTEVELIFDPTELDVEEV